jgi:hypothetical protein
MPGPEAQRARPRIRDLGVLLYVRAQPSPRTGRIITTAELHARMPSAYRRMPPRRDEFGSLDGDVRLRELLHPIPLRPICGKKVGLGGESVRRETAFSLAGRLL